MDDTTEQGLQAPNLPPSLNRLELIHATAVLERERLRAQVEHNRQAAQRELDTENYSAAAASSHRAHQCQLQLRLVERLLAAENGL